MITSTITVQSTHEYPIYVEQGILTQIGTLLQKHTKAKKIALVTHPSLEAVYGKQLKTSIEAAGYSYHPITVKEGESSKSFDTVTHLLNHLFENHFERKDSIIAFGGGVIGDLTGFVASLYLRGISVVQMPTTLLAQVDASIGGKTGINVRYGKNLVGAFHQPSAVIIDPTVLKTLPKRELLCGLAEVVKYGVIMDLPLFDYLETHAHDLAKLTYDSHPDLWEHCIRVSCNNKASVVQQDEKESGLRAILNYGHTIGHVIESMGEYAQFLHGEAVALGMKAAGHIAVQKGLLTQTYQNRILALLTTLGFTLTLPTFDEKAMLKTMLFDKKVKDGKIRFILPTKIGIVGLYDTVTTDEILASLHHLMEKTA